MLSRRAMLAGLAAAGLTITARKSHADAMQPDLSHLTPQQRADHEALRERMVAALPYRRFTVPGDEALSEWQRLRDAADGVPVIIGDDEQLERIAEHFSLDDPAVFPMPSGVPTIPLRSPEQILAAAEALVFPEDLANWSGAYQEEDLTAQEGNWPIVAAANGPNPSIAFDISTRQPFRNVHILLIPARATWEVPAFLRWGDWNACPPPEYHVAALRAWHRRYGAELVGINADTMDVRAARRPADRTEAMSLAREQYRYCPDIVDQGAETISALAAVLTAGDWWYFWWD